MSVRDRAASPFEPSKLFLRTAPAIFIIRICIHFAAGTALEATASIQQSCEMR